MSASLPSVHQHKLALVVRNDLQKIVAFAVRRVRLPPISAPAVRHWAVGAVFALGLAGFYASSPTPTAAAFAYMLAIVLRFGFLFGSFTPRGMAWRLKARFGIARGHELYGVALDRLLLLQRVAFLALVYTTARSASGPLGSVLQALGFVTASMGVVVTLWAARVIGHDGCHYRDLFMGSRSVKLEDAGPYAVCSHPMYVLGPLAGYGLAMLTLSPFALFAAGLNQALLLAFNHRVEQPFLRRANGIFLETQRRYDIARSLLGFDPRQELTDRQHADAADSSLPVSLAPNN